MKKNRTEELYIYKLQGAYFCEAKNEHIDNDSRLKFYTHDKNYKFQNRNRLRESSKINRCDSSQKQSATSVRN